MNSCNPIIIELCCKHQAEAAAATALATTFLGHGLVKKAIQEQREAAYHHEQARIRLERLIDIN